MAILWNWEKKHLKKTHGTSPEAKIGKNWAWQDLEGGFLVLEVSGFFGAARLVNHGESIHFSKKNQLCLNFIMVHEILLISSIYA
jgi:hypothetical protein